jgi:hypothetical protein
MHIGAYPQTVTVKRLAIAAKDSVLPGSARLGLAQPPAFGAASGAFALRGHTDQRALSIHGIFSLISNNILAAHGDNVRNRTACRAVHNSVRPPREAGGPGNSFFYAGHDQ